MNGSNSSNAKPNNIDGNAIDAPQFSLRSRRAEAPIVILLFFSGFAAIVYQIVWGRILLRLSGATLPAVSILLGAFMLGLGIGAVFGGHQCKSPRGALVRYALIEFTIALIALLYVWMLSDDSIRSVAGAVERMTPHAAEALSRPLAAILASNIAIRNILSFCLMVVPASFMGMTLPVVSKAYDGPSSGIYVANLLGSAIGAAAVGFALVPTFGLSTTACIAVCINLSLSLLAFALSRAKNSASRFEDESSGESGSGSGGWSGGASGQDVISGSSCGLGGGSSSGSGSSSSSDSGGGSSSGSGSGSSSGSGSGSSSESGGGSNSIAENEKALQAVIEKLKSEAGLSPLILPLTLVALSGFLSLYLEMVFTRLASFFMGSSTYALSAVLSIVLLSLSVGCFLRPLFKDKVKFEKNVAFLLIFVGYWLNIDLWILKFFPEVLSQVCSGWNLASFALTMTYQVGSLCLMLGPVFAALGLIFPMLVDTPRVLLSPRARISYFFGSSTLGSIAGVAAGLLLIPFFSGFFISGIEQSIIVVIGAASLSGLLLNLLSEGGGASSRITRGVVSVVPLLLLFLKPTWNAAGLTSGLPFITRGAAVVTALNSSTFSSQSVVAPIGANQVELESEAEKMVFYKEGMNSTVSVFESPARNIVSLKNDGKVEASLPLRNDVPSLQSDLYTHLLLGQLPLVFDTGDHQKTFVIGYGAGATCGAAFTSGLVDSGCIAELEHATLETRKFFDNSHDQQLHFAWESSGRAKILEGDGRVTLSALNQSFDSIISQPAEPWVNGAADLYTKEFWELSSRCLADDGVFCQWIQLYSITPEYLRVVLRSFLSVYPNTYAFRAPGGGELILVGMKSEQPLNLSLISQRLKKLRSEGVWLGIRFSHAEELLGWMVATPDSLRRFCTQTNDKRFNTDDNLLTEYALPHALVADEVQLSKNISIFDLSASDWIELSQKLYSGTEQRADFLSSMALNFAHNDEHDTGCGANVSTERDPHELAKQLTDGALRTSHSLWAQLVSLSISGNKNSSDAAKLVPSKQMSSKQILMIGRLLRQRGDLARARSAFQLALSTYPDDADVHAEAGWCEYKCGDFEAARNHYERAIQLDPRSLSTLLLLSMALEKLQEHAAAKIALTSLAAVFPNCSDVHIELAHALYSLHQVDESLEQMKLASKASPGDPRPNIFTTAHYAHNGEWTAARTNLRLLAKKLPTSPVTKRLTTIVDEQLSDSSTQNELARLMEVKGKL